MSDGRRIDSAEKVRALIAEFKHLQRASATPGPSGRGLSTPEEFDPERIVRTLHGHGVECVVVGGIGARLHGATRQTEDFDLVVGCDVDNLRRLAAAMRELGAYIRTDCEFDEATRE